jgi:hypothetical protein
MDSDVPVPEGGVFDGGCISPGRDHIARAECLRPTDQPVISSASDQPALSRTCGPRIGSGILGIFPLVPKSVVSRSGFRKAAPSFGPFVGT